MCLNSYGNHPALLPRQELRPLGLTSVKAATVKRKLNRAARNYWPTLCEKTGCRCVTGLGVENFLSLANLSRTLLNSIFVYLSRGLLGQEQYFSLLSGQKETRLR